LKSVKQIEKIIQEEINSGILPEKVMVMGHSQGGSMALAIGLLTKHKLAGIVCLSGFLPCREEIFNWARAENQEMPFWLFHNYYDNTVPA
jgi:predicted esterase